MRSSRIALLLAVALIVAALPSLALAQQTTSGAIAGRVVDTQGLPIPGATVTVTGSQGARTTVTDGEGRFTLPFLTPGEYTARAELAGFRAVEQQKVAVSLGQRVALTLEMSVGALTETVRVTSSSPVVDSSTTGLHGSRQVRPATARSARAVPPHAVSVPCQAARVVGAVVSVYWSLGSSYRAASVCELRAVGLQVQGSQIGHAS
jgi:hypothetical protein